MVRPPTTVLLAALFLFSCGHQADHAVDATAASVPAGVERTVEEVPSTSGAQATVVDLHIAGMGCEMMCGAAIRKALAKLPGVQGTEIEFDADQEVDHAIVTYDETRVSDREMLEAVQQLHDGQYSVKSIHITRHVSAAPKAGKGEEAARRSEMPAMHVFHVPTPSLPGILAALASILRL